MLQKEKNRKKRKTFNFFSDTYKYCVNEGIEKGSNRYIMYIKKLVKSVKNDTPKNIKLFFDVSKVTQGDS